jgi:hypothetical protein
LDASVHREELERIRITADRMEKISRDIASYSRASMSLQRHPIELGAIAGECVTRHFGSRERAFRIHPMPRGTAIMGDAAKLEQVFVNLFKNALEADAGRVDVRFKIWGNRLVATVEDDGSGCPPEDLERLTLPFFSGKGPGGTGLGCAIAENILKAHGATMRSYSKNVLGAEGSGLVFNLVFPCAEEVPVPILKGSLLVVSEDMPTRSNMILPMIHLGLRPMVLPLEGSVREGGLPDAFKTLFLDQSIAGRYFESHGNASAVVVDRFRRATFSDGPKKGFPAFLFSEENLAELIPEGIFG